MIHTHIYIYTYIDMYRYVYICISLFRPRGRKRILHDKLCMLLCPRMPAAHLLHPQTKGSLIPQALSAVMIPSPNTPKLNATNILKKYHIMGVLDIRGVGGFNIWGRGSPGHQFSAPRVRAVPFTLRCSNRSGPRSNPTSDC